MYVKFLNKIIYFIKLIFDILLSQKINIDSILTKSVIQYSYKTSIWVTVDVVNTPVN